LTQGKPATSAPALAAIPSDHTKAPQSTKTTLPNAPTKTTEAVVKAPPVTTVKIVEAAKPPTSNTNFPITSSTQTGIGVLSAAKKTGFQRGSEKIAASEMPGSGTQLQIMLSSLARFNGTAPDDYHVNVFDKRGDWLKVFEPKSGKGLWVKLNEYSKFIGWKEFFAGRRVKMNPGLPDDNYALFSSNGKEKLGSVTSQNTLTVMSVVEDWALVKSDTLQRGWLRWRNPEKQLVVSTVD
jgi:hypothetical protein